MPEPARKIHPEIEPNIKPTFGVIQGGGQSTPGRANLRAAEQSAGENNGDASSRNLKLVKSDDPSSNISEANERERQGFYTPTNNKPGRDTKLSMRLLKRGGPLGLIVTLLGLGGFAFFGQSTMLINIVSNLTERYDYQNTSMSIRSQRMLAKRLAGNDLTKGSCNTVKIACRYSRPSNRLLKSMADNGLTAYDKDGKVVGKRLVGFPNSKPAKYTFIDSTGKTIDIKAKDLNSTIKNNPEVSRALAGAYRARYMGLSDKIAMKVFQKFGVNKANKLDKSPDEKDARNTLDTESSPDSDGKAPPSEDEIKPLIKEAMDEELKETARTAKKSSDPIQLIGGGLCLLKDTPSLISKVVRTYQMRYLIKYTMVFLSAADAIKAGDGTPEQAAALGTILTEVSMSAGKVTNKSALDSFGMKYALFGDTSTKGYTQNYKKFIPGGGSTLSSITNTTSNPKIQKACNALLGPEGTVLIDSVEAGISVGTAGVGAAAIAIAKAAAWSAMKLGGVDLAVQTIEKSHVIGGVVELISPLTNKIFSSLIQDWTKDIKGEDVGNALASGTGALLGQVASAGGNMPLSQQQALAYNNLTDKVIAKEADYDRSTLSPLDASNPHTFLGTIVTNLLPIYSGFSSTSSSLTTLLSLPSLFSSSLGQNVYASDDAQKYSMCQDSNVQANHVAADPFCNIEYGIPAQYLNEDPDDVLNSLLNANQIDPDSGEPLEGTDLKDWVDECTNGELYQSASCVINDQKHAEYALYLTDSRILDGMDNGPADQASSSATTDTSQSVSSDSVTWPLDKKWWLSDKADFIDAHTMSTGTSWGGTSSQFGVQGNKGAGIAADIGVPIGTPVYAMVGGTVTSTNLCGENDGMAIKSTINGNTLGISYMHGNHQKFKVGDTVNAGDQIMDSGAYGCHVTGPHLHVGMAYAGHYICPQDVFLDLGANKIPDFAALVPKGKAPCGRS